MNKEYLNVILVDNSEENQALFKNIFKDLRIGIKDKIFNTAENAMSFLNSDKAPVPEILFMNYDNPEENFFEYLNECKTDFKLRNIVTVIYSTNLSPAEEEEFFVYGGNIVMQVTDNYDDMKKKLTDVIAINWQYHTSGLNKDNFIMKV